MLEATRNAFPAEWTAAAGQFTRWDWRAVANFVGGGTGAGLLFAATAVPPTMEAYRVQAGLGLAIIAAGLLCIMAKLGRPGRALNIFRHVERSWMTREGFALPTLFGCGALSLLQSTVGVMAAIATLSAVMFLYCQARILRDAKGIPAWSSSEIVALILATGLAEGAGLAVAISLLAPGGTPQASMALLLAAVPLRHLAWRRYRAGLARIDAPEQAIAALDSFSRRWLLPGDGLALVLAGTGLLLGGLQGSMMAAVGGVAAALSGGALKATLLIRAGHYRRKSVSLAAAMAAGHGRG